MIKLIDIKKTFSNHKTIEVLRGVNLEVKAGEIFGIIGLSGAGKSTLLRCVNLLEKPDHGEVWINNQEITQLSGKKLRLIRRDIGMIFQHFNLLSSKTVYQNVALPLQFINVLKNKQRRTIEELLDLTGLTDKKTFYPSKLSGGQKQRVAIARALAYHPKILLCDEATSALDPETTQTIVELLRSINQRLGVTILIITHNIDVVKNLCDRVALMDKGQIIEEAELIEFFTHPKHELTKKLVALSLKQTLPPLLQQRIKANKTHNSHTVLRILFHGQVTAEPLLAHLMREVNMHLNILQANIEIIKNDTLGIMLVEVMGNQAPLQQGIDYLTQKGLDVKVIGYVEGSLV